MRKLESIVSERRKQKRKGEFLRAGGATHLRRLSKIESKGEGALRRKEGRKTLGEMKEKREREKERERERGGEGRERVRQTDRQTDSDRQTDRQTERDRSKMETERQRNREKDRHRHKQRKRREGTRRRGVVRVMAEGITEVRIES